MNVTRFLLCPKLIRPVRITSEECAIESKYHQACVFPAISLQLTVFSTNVIHPEVVSCLSLLTSCHHFRLLKRKWQLRNTMQGPETSVTTNDRKVCITCSDNFLAKHSTTMRRLREIRSSSYHKGDQRII
jgi:hypothetical protein